MVWWLIFCVCQEDYGDGLAVWLLLCTHSLNGLPYYPTLCIARRIQWGGLTQTLVLLPRVRSSWCATAPGGVAPPVLWHQFHCTLGGALSIIGLRCLPPIVGWSVVHSCGRV